MDNPSLAKSDQLLRAGFRYLNRFMLLLWRLGLGSWLNLWPAVLGRYMVLVHRGRKSGLLRRTPVNYCIVDGEVYCVSGFGSVADWYRNLLAQPRVELWLPDGWWVGEATEITEPSERLARMRDALLGSGFAAYAAGIDPRRMSDRELDELTRDYRVLHITRTQARTGPDGPGDLAWVWPAVTQLLLAGAALRGRRKRRITHRPVRA